MIKNLSDLKKSVDEVGWEQTHLNNRLNNETSPWRIYNEKPEDNWFDIYKKNMDEWINNNKLQRANDLLQAGVYREQRKKEINDFCNGVLASIGQFGEAISGRIWLALNTMQNKFIMFKSSVEDIFASIGANIKISFGSAFDGIKQLWNNFANWLNSKLKFDVGEIKNPFSGETISKGFSVDLGKIPTFSGGGIPEDGWFRANQDELIGQFDNGRSAVINNQNILDGLERTFTDSLMNVVMGNSTSDNGATINLEAHIYVGNEEFGIASFKGIKGAQRQGLIPKLI